MKFSQFASSLRTLTGTDTYTLPLEEIVNFANIELDTYGLLGSHPGMNESYFGKTYLRNLEIGVRTYTLPDDLTHISTVALNIAGTWEDAKLYTGKDVLTESEILESMKGSLPRYRIYGNTLKIYSKESITAVTDGIRMEGAMYPSAFIEEDFNSNDRDMSLPRTASDQGLNRAFHKLLLYRVSILYKESRDKPIALNQTEQAYQGQLSDVLDSLGLLVYDRRYRMSEPQDAYHTHTDPEDPLSN